MRWLLTVAADTDHDMLRKVVATAAGSLRDVDPVPMSDDEVVVFAEGPWDFPQRVDRQRLSLLRISPDSEPEPA